MGFKVIVFLGICIGMVLLMSSQVGAARVLAHTTLDQAEKPKRKIIPITSCSRKRYGSCIPNLPPSRKRACEYRNHCKGPPHALP